MGQDLGSRETEFISKPLATPVLGFVFCFYFILFDLCALTNVIPPAARDVFISVHSTNSLCPIPVLGNPAPQKIYVRSAEGQQKSGLLSLSTGHRDPGSARLRSHST